MTRPDIIPLHKLKAHAASHFATRPLAQRLAAAFRDAHYRPNELHRHDYFELFLLSDGGGTCSIEGTDHQLDPGTVLTLPPGVVHGWTDRRELDGFVARVPLHLGFHMPVLSDNEVFALALPRRLRGHLLSLMNWITEEDESRAQRRQPLQQQQWRLFLDCVASEQNMRKPAAQRRQTRPDLFGAFLTLLERKHHLRWGVQDYANTLSVSRSRLLRIVQKRAGCSPADMIRARTLKEAERLLLVSKKTCAEISDELGYSSQAQFSRSFSAQHGMSPSQYRSKMANL